MTKTLFLGDSHSHGYFEMGGKVHAWESNNYAEIYARDNDKQTVIYSIPGGCNRKYPAWLKSMLDIYQALILTRQDTFYYTRLEYCKLQFVCHYLWRIFQHSYCFPMRGLFHPFRSNHVNGCHPRIMF
jgi:hypothetical protein